MPDLRLSAPAGFDSAKDRSIAEVLSLDESRLDFRVLLDRYYQLEPPANADLHARHMAHFHVEHEQAGAVIAELAGHRRQPERETLLDIGCGLGQYLKAGSRRFSAVVGIDLSLAQLVLARKFLAEAGITATLIAAQAERLPFLSSTFGAAVAADSLEHVSDSAATVSEVSRVLTPGGAFSLSTPNRFSLTPEPHVGIWGLGYRPRSWAVRHVRRKLGVRYDNIRLFSYWTLRKLLEGRFAGPCELRLPDVGRDEKATFSPAKRRLAGVYETMRGVPLLRTALFAVAPNFQAVCVKRGPSGQPSDGPAA